MPSYNTTHHLRSYRRNNHVNFTRLIERLASENREEHPEFTKLYALHIPHRLLNQLLRAIPYSYHLLETHTPPTPWNNTHTTFVVIPYNYTRINIVVNTIEGILGYHPYRLPDGRCHLLFCLTYLNGPPRVCIVHKTSNFDGPIIRQDFWI